MDTIDLLIWIIVILVGWSFILICLLVHEKRRTDKIEEALYKHYFHYGGVGNPFAYPRFSGEQLNQHIDARTQLSDSKCTYPLPLRDVVFAILAHLGLKPERNTVPAVSEIKLVARRG